MGCCTIVKTLFIHNKKYFEPVSRFIIFGFTLEIPIRKNYFPETINRTTGQGAK